MTIDVIIPALNERDAIAGTVGLIPRPPAREVIVVDNGSTDGTGDAARAAGARVVVEPRRGYGSACLAGLRALSPDTEIVVFLDADGSDDPAFLPQLVRPITTQVADLVVASRTRAIAERGALTFPQRTGNLIAAAWLRARFGLPATDLGPFRAVRKRALENLRMSDTDFGWTVEMQLEAARARLRYAEIAVPYRRRRAGVSKVSGTVRGVSLAAVKILWLLVRYEFSRGRPA